jgi:hypothetical protein
MNSFADLADRSINFALATLKEAEDEVIEALQTSGATRHVKNLQMIQLSRAIIAVGMFSIFESVVKIDWNVGTDLTRCANAWSAKMKMTSIIARQSG